MRFVSRSAALLVLVVRLLAYPASAAELAHLRNGFTIRHEYHAVLGETTRLFLAVGDTNYIDVPTAEIEGFEKDLTLVPNLPSPSQIPPATDLNQVVNFASGAYHLDPDLVNSVIHAESGFNSNAVSRKGAQGLMQLMPGTARRLGVTNPFDPAANVGGGTHYLRQLLERYNFDLVKALAAYNAGPQRVEQYRGVPPYHETRAYVSRIVRDYNRKKAAEEKASTELKNKSKKKSRTVLKSASTNATTPKTTSP